MYPNRSLHMVAPQTWEANEMPATSAVYAEVLRNGIRDIGVVGGSVHIALSTVDPVRYPGLLAGNANQGVNAGIATFNGLSVNVPGPYTLTTSVENDNLQQTATSPTIGSITLWRLYNIGIVPDSAYLGYWINITGTGVTVGIWGKIVDMGSDVTLGDYFVVEQPPSGVTSISTLTSTSAILTVRYNSAAPLAQPSDFLMNGMDSWFAWNPDGGTSLNSYTIEGTGETLSALIDIQVLRNVSIHITSCPATAEAGVTYSIFAALRNKNGTTASDITGVNIALEIRDGVTPVYSATPSVVDGKISTTVVMPTTAKTYTIWVQYQGTWYQAASTEDSKSVLVTVATTTSEPPGPDPVTAKFPPPVYSLSVGGCPLPLQYNRFLELGTPDPLIEVLVK